MNIPGKKLKNGFSIPVYGLGTWKMGGGRERDFNNDDNKDIQAIKTAIELGITHIDTAEIYANGHAEEIIAQAINAYDRSKLFIVSKVFPGHFSFTDVITSCQHSLKRLKTDYLDLYLLHAYSNDGPLPETMKAMDKLVFDGLIKNIGVSNFSVENIKEAQSLTANKIVCNQVHYNLIYREPEKSGLLKYCQDNDIILAAWRPIEKGQIMSNPPQVLLNICQKYQKTPAQVAINWLISQNNVITLAKTSNIEHLKENLDAVNWAMADKDIEKLRKEFPGQQDVSNAVPLGKTRL